MSESEQKIRKKPALVDVQDVDVNKLYTMYYRLLTRLEYIEDKADRLEEGLYNEKKRNSGLITLIRKQREQLAGLESDESEDTTANSPRGKPQETPLLDLETLASERIKQLRRTE